MKVWKSVGAVAVYSAWRATAIVLVLAGLLVAVGFGIGRVTDDEDKAVASTPAPRPAAVQAGDDKAADTSGAADSEKPRATPAAGKRAYRTGYRDGARRALGELTAGSAYMVKVVKGSSGVRIGPSVMARPGFQYRLCRSGQSVCESGG